MKIKVLLLAVLTATFLIACQSKPASNAPSATTIGGLPWAGDQDVVCEMKIDQTVEDTLHYSGKVYGFCGTSCKEKFQENPAKYVGK